MKKYFVGAVFSVFILCSPSLVMAQTPGLTGAQIQAILSLLSSFGADSTVVAKVNDVLTGSTPSAPAQSFCYNFQNDLAVGSGGDILGADVMALKRALAISGMNVAQSKVLFDEDTAVAVIAFQAKHGLRQTGYVGPMTRAKLNALYRCGNTQPVLPVLPTVQLAPSISRVEPASAPVGSTVTVYGSNFDSISYIQFGDGLIVKPILRSDTALNFVVPSKIGFGAQLLKVVSEKSGTSAEMPLNILGTSTPSIIVLWPNGGENISINSNVLLKFKVSNNDMLASNRIITLSAVDKNGNDVHVVHDVNNMTTEYHWVIKDADLPLGLYKVHLTVSDENGRVIAEDYSDAYFTISKSSTVTIVSTSVGASYLKDFEVFVGQLASIYGTNLAGSTASTTKVYIGGVRASVQTIYKDGGNKILVRVPDNLIAGRMYHLRVINEKGVSNIVTVKVLKPMGD